jgi:hypothetical protein
LAQRVELREPQVKLATVDPAVSELQQGETLDRGFAARDSLR